MMRCEICEAGEEETLEHFVKECEALEGVRRKFGVEGLPIETLLLFEGGEEEEAEKYKEYIEHLWSERRRRRGLQRVGGQQELGADRRRE